jgi:hypothetical protein
MSCVSRCLRFAVPAFVLLAVPFLVWSAWAQGLPQSSSNVLSMAAGLDLAPSNPTGMPGSSTGLRKGSDSIYLSDRMLGDVLRPIANLQMGYLYYFGETVGANRLTLNYLPRIKLGPNSVVFGEVNGEFTNFWNSFRSLFGGSDTNAGSNGGIDLSFGGGYRKIFHDRVLLGVNGFYDATKLDDKWYNSGGVGVEFVALLPGHDALDLTFNWYGNPFNADPLARSFSNCPGNYDLHLGYSHELWNGGPDLRVYGSGYEFSAGNGPWETRVYGTRGGAELKTRDGRFVVRYEAARDPLNGTYHTVGGYVNVGFDIARLFSGDNPIDLPEPIFASPRNLSKWLVTPASTRRRRLNGATSGRYCVVGRSPWYAAELDPRYLSPALPDDLSPYTRVRVIWTGVTSNSTQFFAFTDSKRNVYGTDNIHFTGDGTFTGTLYFGSIYSPGQYPRTVQHSVGTIEYTGSICFEFLE